MGPQPRMPSRRRRESFFIVTRVTDRSPSGISLPQGLAQGRQFLSFRQGDESGQMFLRCDTAQLAAAMDFKRLLHRFGAEFGVRVAARIFDGVNRAAGEKENVLAQA